MEGSWGAKFDYLNWPKGDKYMLYSTQVWMWLVFLADNGFGAQIDRDHLQKLVTETLSEHDVKYIDETPKKWIERL